MIKSWVQNTVSRLTQVLKPSFSKMWTEFEFFSFLTCLAVKCGWRCIPQRANPLCRWKRRVEKKSYFDKNIFCGKNYFLCPWKLNVNKVFVVFFFKVSVNVCLSVCLWEEKHFPTSQRKTNSPKPFLDNSPQISEEQLRKESLKIHTPPRHITKPTNECFVFLR